MSNEIRKSKEQVIREKRQETKNKILFIKLMIEQFEVLQILERKKTNQEKVHPKLISDFPEFQLLTPVGIMRYLDENFIDLSLQVPNNPDFLKHVTDELLTIPGIVDKKNFKKRIHLFFEQYLAYIEEGDLDNYIDIDLVDRNLVFPEQKGNPNIYVNAEVTYYYLSNLPNLQITESLYLVIAGKKSYFTDPRTRPVLELVHIDDDKAAENLVEEHNVLQKRKLKVERVIEDTDFTTFRTDHKKSVFFQNSQVSKEKEYFSRRGFLLSDVVFHQEIIHFIFMLTTKLRKITPFTHDDAIVINGKTQDFLLENAGNYTQKTEELVVPTSSEEGFNFVVRVVDGYVFIDIVVNKEAQLTEKSRKNRQ